MVTSKDHLEQRCPRLGGPVSFHYCRTCGDDSSACWKIFDCWWECFDVVGYLQKYLPEDKFNILVNAKPKPKMLSLMELIEQAKKRAS
ncbi:MAG: hypothetical protein BBJ57_11435 [Desulfobacterales bacterium PC51MH44]|nr:MAG: hypothetical protein BBJ57_11435 [Desulfobacterales bacterium PC51MH44]